MKPRILVINFSGGRTSAYMTWRMLRYYKCVWNSDLNSHVGVDSDGVVLHIIVIFANTSKERYETLQFVNQCDEEFGFHTVWVEAVIHYMNNVGTTHKVVNFNNACTDGSIFEQFIIKYGIPNMGNPSCTRELKARPIRSYLRDLGLDPSEYYLAIGYRVDEPSRWGSDKQRKNQIDKRHIYYFVDIIPTTKQQVNKWWLNQSFNLMLREHQGNCSKCYKKNLLKLIAVEIEEIAGIMKTDPWWSAMEVLYGNHLPESHKKNKNIKLPIVFYREKRSSLDIRQIALDYTSECETIEDFEVIIDTLLGSYNPDEQNKCAESCEPF